MEKKFIIEQKELLSVLTAMQPICTRRTTLDATSCIMFHIGAKELILKSTDLEISLQASCPIIESDFRQAEQFLVPGKRIFDIVKELNNTITLELRENQLNITCDDVHLTLNIKEASEFPPLPERIENLMQVESETLKSMLESVSFLVPQNNSNPALNGLFIEVSPETFKMTATDGHSLAQVSSTEFTLETAQSWLLPRRAVFELKKILESYQDTALFLGTCSSQLVFSGQHFNFFSKLLVDTFPKYQPILQKDGFHAAKLDRAHFLKTLKRSTCLLSGQFIATQFKFSHNTVHVVMNNKEVGKLNDRVPLYEYTHDEIDVRFYAPYLLSGVQSFEENIKFYLHSASKPIIFEAASEKIKRLYLVMPVSAAQSQN
ncbi:MAG: DNA polymerase III subunit beta [Candidatus Babeliaceae bacterium]|nr:DNA polymerase III subunit beta [Candidatus Babeliaceae bacterium]